MHAPEVDVHLCVCVWGGSTCLYVFVDRNEYIIQENKAFKFSYVFNIFTGVTCL